MSVPEPTFYRATRFPVSDIPFAYFYAVNLVILTSDGFECLEPRRIRYDAALHSMCVELIESTPALAVCVLTMEPYADGLMVFNLDFASDPTSWERYEPKILKLLAEWCWALDDSLRMVISDHPIEHYSEPR